MKVIEKLEYIRDLQLQVILVAYLLELIQDLTDLAFEIHDRQIMILLSKERKAQEGLTAA